MIFSGLFISGFECAWGVSDDTLRSVKTHFQSSLGVTLFAGREPTGRKENMATFDSRSELIRSAESSGTRSEIKMLYELGFTGFADSTWIKNNDRLQTTCDFRSGTGPAQHRFRVEFETGIFNDHEWITNPSGGSPYRETIASVLNPATLETGYGFSMKPNPFYEIGLSLSTAKIRTIPINSYQFPSPGIEIAKLNRSVVVFNYGFSIQLEYSKAIREMIEIKGSGNLFVRGIKKEEMEGDAALQMTIHLTKWLEIRMFSRVDYDSSAGKKVRYRTEILTGLYYENVR